MASIDDLMQAIVATLDRKGVMAGIKAQVRREIFTALEDEPEEARDPPLRENVLINELIREYLQYNGYLHTASVLQAEASHPEVMPLDRNFLKRELRLQLSEEYQSLPLLYAVIGRLSSQMPVPDPEPVHVDRSDALSSAPSEVSQPVSSLSEYPSVRPPPATPGRSLFEAADPQPIVISGFRQ
mmetsp:Transcript_48008/g.104390  ORF Transcript_48008/g.104390 Transcript_48008/m.104390 type:complete len:184 (+) Transcript_48008:21-572(+)